MSQNIKEVIVGVLTIIGGLTVANIIITILPSIAMFLFYALIGGIGAYVALQVKKNKDNK
ncbi:gp146 [Bacillus phage W.Ph.]|uniref:Gp146 n=1 Tax=Bacillus phage W.Ph. TaxID=764595 RepID=G9B1P7_9CAUD|nr:gp146 [Bacillus phage W.Ph.]ADH03292.1 gp146 [Bacillus phage W.Ph.]